MKFLEFSIPENCELSEQILSHFKKQNYPFTKQELLLLIKAKQVYFDKKPVPFLPFKVFKKGKVQLFLNLKGADLSNQIIFEDQWMIVINKPAELPSQSSLTFLQDHAYGATACMMREKKPFSSPTLFLMHRLDVSTSGVLMMSKKSSINKHLQTLFEKKLIKKTYYAISKSMLKPPPKVIKSYLGRKPDHIHSFKFASVPKETPRAKYAETHVELIDQNQELSFFKISPQTGRSHQIRVHLSEHGLPILGDKFYIGEEASNLFLHASELSFKHPLTEQHLTIKAPLPLHWRKLLDKSGLSL